MPGIFQDVRYGARVLKASPTMTAVAVLNLALGVAVSTTVFNWIDGLLLRPYPGVDHTRLAVLEGVEDNGQLESPLISLPDFLDFRANLKLLSGLVAHNQIPISIGQGEKAQRVWGEVVSGDYFQMLGVKPALGRVFTASEFSERTDSFVAVISDRLWRNSFQGNRGVLGKVIRMNRQPVTIVGVAPPEFHGVTAGLAFDAWVPAPNWASEMDRSNRQYEATARLRPGVTLAQADSELKAVAARLARMYPNTNRRYSARLVPTWDAQSGAPRIVLPPLRILAVACLLVLLVACANIANLLLANSLARQREFGIRLALGASSGRLVRQLLTESVLLALLGLLLAAPATLWMGDALVSFIPATGMSLAFQFALSGRVIAFAALLALVTALAAAAIPALHVLRNQPNETLKQGGRTSTGGVSSHRASGLLVMAEVSLALVALVGAVLFLRTVGNLRNVNPGFDPRNVLLARIPLNTSNYTEEQGQQFCRRLRDRMAAMPGVLAAGYGDRIPLGFGRGPWRHYQVDSPVTRPGEDVRIDENTVSTGYFETLRTPLVAGRDFRPSDADPKSQRVAIVSEAFARRFYGSRDPIGRRVRRSGQDHTIVGVAKDAKIFSLSEAPLAYVYTPFERDGPSNSNSGVSFYVRTEGDPRAVIPVLRREMAAIDPNSSGFEAMPLAEYTGAALFVPRLAGTLLAALGCAAMLLAAAGLYSVISYAVGRRTPEIGIRMALGAAPRTVLGMIVRQGMLLTLGGIAIGAALALSITRLVGHLLYGVAASDPLSYAAAVLFLGAVALAAAWVPARRATRVNPVAALREQ